MDKKGGDSGRVEGKGKEWKKKRWKKGKREKVVLGKVLFCFFFFSQSILWASASEPAGSVPATQSREREVGTIALWPHARAC